MMPESNGILTYSSNNSGGRWPLKPKDWDALATAGWIVHWVHTIEQIHPDHTVDPTDNEDPHNWPAFGGHTHQYSLPLLPAIRDSEWLGANAKSAAKRFVTPDDGVIEWEHLTGQYAGAAGCRSCGPPHMFDWEPDDGTYRQDFHIDYEEDDED